MRKIVIVDDQVPWSNALVEQLKVDFGEELDIEAVTDAGALDAILSDRSAVDQISYVFVDLELGGSSSVAPADYMGRDEILPLLRMRAPWIPVALLSRYVTQLPTVLANVSPYGFDAIICKDFFLSRSVYRREWTELKRALRVARAASQAGRSVFDVMEALENTPELKCASGVRAMLDSMHWGDLNEALAIMGLTGRSIVLDSVTLGYSGLVVMKAICGSGEAETAWLLKGGADLLKLHAETSAHRRMFESGFTRKMSVPLFRMNPVVWNGFGLIAYEFESDARTLDEVCCNDGIQPALKLLRPALDELYRGASEGRVFPKDVLLRLVEPDLRALVNGSASGLLTRFLKGDTDRTLDESMGILVGPEHGDLHCGNVLVRDAQPVLIDFAHYRTTSDSGVPIVDLATLCVDVVVRGLVPGFSIEDLLTKDLIEESWLAPIVDAYLRTEIPRMMGQRNLLQTCVVVLLANRLTYSGTENAVRNEIRRALWELGERFGDETVNT